jgi:hypothetical protein
MTHAATALLFNLTPPECAEERVAAKEEAVIQARFEVDMSVPGGRSKPWAQPAELSTRAEGVPIAARRLRITQQPRAAEPLFHARIALSFRLPIEDDGDGGGVRFPHNGVHHERLTIGRNHILLSVLEADNAAYAHGE